MIATRAKCQTNLSQLAMSSKNSTDHFGRGEAVNNATEDLVLAFVSGANVTQVSGRKNISWGVALDQNSTKDFGRGEAVNNATEYFGGGEVVSNATEDLLSVVSGANVTQVSWA